MSNLTKPRIKLPDTIKSGDVIDVHAGITHVMETGNRRDSEGRPIPRNVVNSVVATFSDEVVFTAKFGSGTAANPIIVFPMRVLAPGRLEITWMDEEGRLTSDAVNVLVNG